MSGAGTAAERWARELAAWRIPDEILSRAPESPWAFPPALFGAEGARDGALHELARAALEGGGRVLDVGCGGGAASVPLAPPATELVGVDSSPEMLAAFARAAGAAGVTHREVLGDWPGVAGKVVGDAGRLEVVVCRNVVYNVADVAGFLTALSASASRRVVVELTETHPSAPLAPLWMHFWGLSRPDGPTAGLFLEVIDGLGYRPQVVRRSRPAVKSGTDLDDHVAFVRRRLCLDRSRDPEVRAALAGAGLSERDSVATVVVAWDP